MTGTFDVTTIAIPRYAHPFLEPLDGLEDDAAAIAALLGRLGGRPPGAPDGGPVVKAEAERRLQAWWRDREPSSSMLIWMGHGWAGSTEAALACHDTEDPVQAYGLGTQVMATALQYDWNRRRDDAGAWTVLFVDACGAGRFVSRVGALIEGAMPSRIALFGVASVGANYVGRLRHALAQVIGRLTPADAYIRLNDLLEQLSQLLGEGNREYLHRNVPYVLLPHRPDPGDRVDADPEPFVGRRAERDAVADWLRTARNGLLVVTGRPGCGKSALLGQVRRESGPDAFDAFLPLANLETGDVVRRLAEELGSPLPRDVGPGDDIDLLAHELRDRRFTVMVDDLDEATDPIALAGTVLRRLAALPGGRVLAGTRPSTGDAVDEPPASGHNLTGALRHGSTRVLELPHDPAAIAEYVRRRLTGLGPATDVDSLAEVLGSLGPARDFLFARLVVHEVRARPELLSDPLVDGLVAGGHRDLFRVAVDRLEKTVPNAVPLLEALALARGPGVPRAEGMWAGMATVIGGVPKIPESDIDRLLEAAAPYILVHADDYHLGVYRLAHQSYRTILPRER